MHQEVPALDRFCMKREAHRSLKWGARANAKGMGQQHTIGWTKTDSMVVGAIQKQTWGSHLQGQIGNSADRLRSTLVPRATLQIGGLSTMHQEVPALDRFCMKRE